MTGLEILLYAYLAGWLGTSSYGIYQCGDSGMLTKTECRVVAVVAGAAWPAIVVNEIKGPK